MIHTIARGASRSALEADLARIEALETDPSWRGMTEPAKVELRQRIEHLDRTGREVEIRASDFPMHPSVTG